MAWSMYDFANSAFATSVLGVVYQVYFTTRVAAGATWLGREIPGLSLWGYTVAAAMAVTVVTAPALGAIADFSGRKKMFLLACWLASWISTALLYWVTPGRAFLGMALLFVGLIGFSAGNAFYNAFLPEIVPSDQMGRASGFGQALGYLGGGLCLLLNLLLIRAPSDFGIPGENDLPVRVSMVVVAAWFALFAIPAFVWVKERPRTRRPPEGQGYLAAGYRQVLKTLRNVRQYPQLARFLLAGLCFMEGIETVILMASGFAARNLGMSQEELVRCYLLIQAVAIAGALAFGWLADRWGHREAILASLVVWCGLIVAAYFVKTAGQFWALGVGVGIVLGGTQACSRSLVGRMTPPSYHAEVFGFYAMAGKAASVIGPLVMAVLTQWFHDRLAILSMIFFFLAGLALTWRVHESQGIEEARGDGAGRE